MSIGCAVGGLTGDGIGLDLALGGIQARKLAVPRPLRQPLPKVCDSMCPKVSDKVSDKASDIKIVSAFLAINGLRTVAH